MANNKYIRGLSGRGFRVRDASDAWKTVKEGAALNTQVDLEDDSTQKILSRERDNFIRVAANNSTTAIIQSLHRKGLRLRPAGGTFTVTIATPGVFSKTAHGFVAGDALVFSTTGALPTGLTAGTTYYVISTGLSANAFRVSATVGGAAVNTTGTQSGTHTVAAQRRNVVMGDTITVSLNDGDTKRLLKRNFGRWIVASGSVVDIVGLQEQQASFRVLDPTMTLEFTGANNNLTFESIAAGGDVVTVELIDPGTNQAAISAAVVGDTAIEVELDITQNVQASMVAIAGGQGLTLTATAAYPGDTGEAITVAFIMPPDTDEVVPISVDVPQDEDIVVSLAVAADGSTATSTAAQIRTAILAHSGASALVTPTISGTGTSLGVAFAEAPLTGGTTEVVRSTAANVKTEIEATPAANALVSVTFEGTGAGLVAPVAATTIGADPESLSKGEVVTGVDLTNPFNVGQLRRRFKAWVEN